ncbi:MAG: mandelate racemase/muconate lactonizing enzyme family protein, partial [Planctomycetes bacterium]|nr:mandelate racemase/muconate lactonizing enzyme family protein [Planctomycetota bacterium]
MKIDRIECVNLRFEYPRGQGFHYGGGQCSARVTSLVLVHTDTGQVGIGSAYAHPGLVHLVVEHQLAPLLRGDDPTKVEDLWAKMYGLTRWYGRKGAAMAALGALDVAFWDLRGKAAGQPLWRMLGGSRGTSPAYASALLWKDQVSELAEEAGRHLARGFRRMKLRMGKSEEYDCAAVRAVRAAIGP